MKDSLTPKTLRARELGVSRSTLYYKPKMAERDWKLKCEIEEVLRQEGCQGYGSPRISEALKRNHKVIERVMNLFGIKAYRRRGKRPKKKAVKIEYPNLLLTACPMWKGHIWAADFTEVWWLEKKIYLATVIDLYTREIVGMAVSYNKGVQLTAAALWNALLNHPRPSIFHSDNGSEYRAAAFVEILTSFGVLISRSAPGCPWENGYQESFYDKWKVDFGDPGRYRSFGELVSEVYRSIWIYNNKRIHTALRMPPSLFALQAAAAYDSGHKVGV
ncbi:MAG: IS3 family transposase [Patescibacteria group bacterium]|nr:IS3 family transposase [Patescibacteria group bacterium]MDE1940578.1 IS3 family transposase [Patescibacteria group bacterium]MDE1967133.1 IS3 family transposase [Patescibacteria group bacterium]